MAASRHSRKMNVGIFALTIGIGVFSLWFMRSADTVNARYDEILAKQKTMLSVVLSVRIGNDAIDIPTWEFFTPGHVWSLVSKAHSLPATFTPELVATSVAHTSTELQVARTMNPKLQSMFEAAESDGSPLMLSSAYRSQSAQQEIYDGYLRLYGQSYVNSYVALPGTSEHQTGLAVDIASYSDECAQTADDCSLDYEAIVWLNQNAAQFGFIQRYPSGKQSITGIAGEAWHYRYVGTELARLLTNSGMTLDEFVQQTAPGYSK